MARLTIPDEQTFATFTVVTSTTAFPITFSLFAKADLTVLVDGVALDQSAFSFSGTVLEGGGYDGGTVTLNAAVDDVTVRIERNVAPARTSNFAPASNTPVQTVDQALNRLTAVQQDQKRREEDNRAYLDAAIEEAGDAIGLVGKLDRDGGNIEDASALRYVLGVQATNTYSLLNALTAAERADVLAGTNAIDITTKFATLVSNLAANEPGATLDASMVTGTWTWTSDPFNPGGELGSAPITVRLGDVTIKKNFNAGGIILPSHFTLEMGPKTKFAPTIKIDSIPGDANPSVGMLMTHLAGSNSLSGTNGSAVVTLDFAYAGRVNVGARLAIFGMEALTQNAVAISGAISSSATSITLASDVTDEIGGVVYLKIDSEIIKGSVTGTTMTVSQRGANGTTAASHADGATATQMVSRIYKIVAKSGTSVTLDSALDRSLTGATWRCGSVDTRIIGSGTIDGELNRADAASNNWLCISSTLSENLEIRGGVRLLGGDHGGLNLTGCRNANVEIDQVAGCGMPADGLGSSLWLFGDVADCRVRIRNVDDGSLGVAIDNKSFGTFEYGLIKSSERNIVEIGSITNHDYSYNISASHNNVLRIGLNMGGAGVVENGSSQLITPIPPTGNSVIVDAQPNASGVQVANPADNYISINGKTGREVKFSTTTGSDLYVLYDTNLSVTTSATGARAGDEVTVRTTTALSTLTGVTAACYTNDVVTLLFQSQSVGTKTIPTGTVLNITARGPW